MEENKEIEALDSFMKKYIKEVKQDVPSLDFTSKVLDQITIKENCTSSGLYQNNVKLSNSLWFVFGGFFVAILGSYFSVKPSGIFKITEYFSFLKFNFSTVLFPKIGILTTYSLLCLTLFCAVQVFYLKRKFDKL